MKFPIYLDNHSTTPMDPRVLEAMLPYFTEKFGNVASRNHAFGWQAEEGVENARKQIAKLIHADPKEIVFTSGATESDNLALKGVVEMYHEKGDHIITSSTEHRAVLDTAKGLEAKLAATLGNELMPAEALSYQQGPTFGASGPASANAVAFVLKIDKR